MQVGVTRPLQLGAGAAPEREHEAKLVDRERRRWKQHRSGPSPHRQAAVNTERHQGQEYLHLARRQAACGAYQPLGHAFALTEDRQPRSTAAHVRDHQHRDRAGEHDHRGREHPPPEQHDVVRLRAVGLEDRLLAAAGQQNTRSRRAYDG